MTGSEKFKPALGMVRRHLGKGVLVLVVIALVLLAGPRYVLGPQVAVETVVQRDFVQSVVASGRVETPHRVNVGVQITGTVLRVPVSEGQSVAAGDTLIELEASELSAARVQAELGVRLAQANHAAAQRALVRSRDLFKQGFISQAALDEALRVEDVNQAALSQAQAGTAVARARQGYAKVTAPVAGTLIARNVEPGDVVQSGKVLMVLSPQSQSGETQLVVQIDEKNLRLLRLGQAALASADAYAQQHFAAELVFINPGIDPQRGAVEVKLHVAAPPDYLKQDMTVSVDIETARRTNAVLVPAAALHDADKATPWVLKIELDGMFHRVRRQPVTLGLRSNGLAEVLTGLQAGDQIIPSTGAGVALAIEGARVRPMVASPEATAQAR